MAAEPERRAMVWVRPPLLASGPSKGSALIPGHEASGQLKFPPPPAIVVVITPQCPPLLLATMVFLRIVGSTPSKLPSSVYIPLTPFALFPEIVLLVTVRL